MNDEDPYQVYMLRHPSDRASNLVPQLQKQPEMANTRLRYRRIAPNARSGSIGSLGGHFPARFKFPPRPSLLESLTSDEEPSSTNPHRRKRQPSRRRSNRHTRRATVTALAAAASQDIPTYLDNFDTNSDDYNDEHFCEGSQNELSFSKHSTTRPLSVSQLSSTLTASQTRSPVSKVRAPAARPLQDGSNSKFRFDEYEEEEEEEGGEEYEEKIQDRERVVRRTELTSNQRQKVRKKVKSKNLPDTLGTLVGSVLRRGNCMKVGHDDVNNGGDNEVVDRGVESSKVGNAEIVEDKEREKELSVSFANRTDEQQPNIGPISAIRKLWCVLAAARSKASTMRFFTSQN